MRRPKTRTRKVSIDEKLIELFKAALPAHEALWYDATHDRRRMTTAEHAAACDACYAFDKAAGVKPWEFGPLHSRASGHWGTMREALLKAINAEDGRAA